MTTSRTSTPTSRSTTTARTTEPRRRPAPAPRTPRILGVDPGTRVTGWGLLGGSVSHPTLIDCGEIRAPESLALPRRLALIQREFAELLERLRPDESAVESPFAGISPRAALQLAHARGVLLAQLAIACVPVVEYPPATVKKAVAGSGRADKEQVRRMVRGQLGRAIDGVGDDVTDALAVGICHLASRAFGAAVARASDAGRTRG